MGLGLWTKGVRTRPLCALCNDSIYNSELFLQQTGDNIKQPISLEAEGQRRE